MALYLKYRPQTLDQLIGQEQIKKTLLSAFQSNKLSHAYLFVGPRGTGKTSTARILAKMVNCENQTSVLSTESSDSAENNLKSDSFVLGTEYSFPCNQCSSCISITDGSSLDLIEIDAASNRGIDDIRTLRENIKLSPASSNKKIYIIDEVHMLTTEAFNALLKTLEEPPKHALFILATTDVQKVPQTILSRVQRLDFKLANSEDLTVALNRIIDAEKIEIESDALKIIVKKAEGSFRDAVKILDQISSSGTKIAVSDVSSVLQTVELDILLEFLKLLSAKNVTDSLKFISENITKGSDAKGWIISLTDILRSLMLIKSGVGNELVATEYDKERYSQLEKLAQQFEISDLVKILDLLQQALEKIRFTSIAILPLELVVVEVCLESSTKLSAINEFESSSFKQSFQASLISIQTSEKILSARVHEGSQDLKLEEQSTAVIPTEVKRVEGSSQLKVGEKDSSTTLRFARNDDESSKSEIIPDSKPASDDAVNKDIATLQEKWNFVLETVKPYNFSLEALLRLVKILEVTTGMVVIEVPYSFHQRILEAPKSRDLLESVLSDVLGKPTRVSCVVAQKPMTVEDVANVEVAQDDEIIKAATEIFSSDSN